jgi:probable rRNA maturation factor
MIHLQIAETLRANHPDLIQSSVMKNALLQKAAEETLHHIRQGNGQVEVTIVLTDDERIRELNRQFLGFDTPTDVLAFPSEDTDPDTDSLYLGDIVISYPQAALQANQGGHSVQAELQLLVVHGMLHLLGYDHAEEQQQTAMWAEQRKILDQLGVGEIETPG